ncbi:hypothetical protein DB30_07786 [Enhygromyxa salina]|uniref:Uncharacterized protein n=1 Tax=Enhygromyxa salina TaxID=215803 RepID=A0A0C2D6I3_9BACT|nr:hypothetical protein [Enhygromyxa salina]KIG18771.1 hypothetical protein DB30_07786 [Enhygromyxa salina]
MLPCPGCQRHIRPDHSACPFCARPTASAATLPTAGLSLAFTAGLSLFACTTGDDSSDTQQEQELDEQEFGGADYGGAPPPCDDTDDAQLLVVGSNAVDTTDAVNVFESSCDQLSGTGADVIYKFIPESSGIYNVTLVNPDFEGWLLPFGDYLCEPYSPGECVPAQALEIQAYVGTSAYIILDGTAGGTATIDISAK